MLNLNLPVLLLNAEVIDNSYQAINDAGEVPSGDVIVSREQLDLLDKIDGKKALYLTAEDSPEQYELPLEMLDMIAINFEKFADGRGYSFATFLRRQGFKGELRAVGDIFKDVLNYLKRSGFDSFVIKEGKDISVAASGLNDFSDPYQFSTANPKSQYQTGL